MSIFIPACSICPGGVSGGESRTLSIISGRLKIGRRGESIYTFVDDERAVACGQTCALVLTERFLERGTFEAGHRTAGHTPAARAAHRPAA